MELSKKVNKKFDKPSLRLIITFWVLIGVFLLIVSEFFISAVRELFRGSLIFLLPLGFLVGAVSSMIIFFHGFFSRTQI